MRFVAASTPGSGTRYLAKVFNEAGLSCGHERAFPAPEADGTVRVHRDDGWGEVSWAAAPALPLLRMPRIHLVRHPLKSISTMLEMKWTDRRHRDALAVLVPGLYDIPEGPQRLAFYWLRWHEMCEQADVRWQVENITARDVKWVDAEIKNKLLKPEEIAEAIRRVPTNTGHRTRSYLEWSDLGVFEDRVKTKAVEYGYE